VSPLSHPFVERLIGTIRREFLDHTLFWNATDLERKLETFRQYYNTHRVHSSLDGGTPRKLPAKPPSAVLISTISSGDLIAVNYFSCLLPHE
jgi:transposase InsO family protein